MVKADLLDHLEPLLESRSRPGTKWTNPNNLAITRDELYRMWYKRNTVVERRVILTRPLTAFYLGHTKSNSPLNCSLDSCYLTKSDNFLRQICSLGHNTLLMEVIYLSELWNFGDVFTAKLTPFRIKWKKHKTKIKLKISHFGLWTSCWLFRCGGWVDSG